MSTDVRIICQREILRYKLSKGKRRNLRSIFKGCENDIAINQADDTFTEDDSRRVRSKRLDSLYGKLRGNILSFKVDSLYLGLNDSVSLRSSKFESPKFKKGKKKKRVVISNKLEEEKIATDVENPGYLQRVRTIEKQNLNKVRTFMPSFLRRNK